MADEDDRPYTTYRSRPRFLRGRDDGGLGRNGDGDGHRPEYQLHGRRRRFSPRELLRRTPGRGITVGRVLRYVALAALTWILISAIVFLISAQIQEAKTSSAAENELDPAGYTLTSPNTVLMLGSDARTKGTKEPGANVIGTPSVSYTHLTLPTTPYV